jgi:two-component system sensor histidine kinase KdpD
MSLFHYIGGLMMMVAVTIFSIIINKVSRIELSNVALLYQLPVMLSAFWWGRWPSYLTALCSVIVFDFLFIYRLPHFGADGLRYLWSFATFLFVAFVIGGRTDHLRMEAAAARIREKSTRALYHFSREIAAITDLKTITQGMVTQAGGVINRAIAVLLPGKGGQLEVWAEYDPNRADDQSENLQQPPIDDPSEAAVASWAYQHGQVTGKSTETLPGANYLYIPLKTREEIVGVLRIHIGESKLTPEERRLVDAWTGLAAMAVDRAQSAQSKCTS